MRLFRDRSTDDKVNLRIAPMPEARSEPEEVTEVTQGEEAKAGFDQGEFEKALFAILQRQKAFQERLAATTDELAEARAQRRRLFLAGNATDDIDVVLTQLERDVSDLTLGIEETQAELDASEKNRALMRLLDAQRELWISRKRQIEIGRITLELRHAILKQAAEEDSLLERVIAKQAAVEKLGGPVSSWQRIGILPDAVPDAATMEKMQADAAEASVEVEKALAALENPSLV